MLRTAEATAAPATMNSAFTMLLAGDGARAMRAGSLRVCRIA